MREREACAPGGTANVACNTCVCISFRIFRLSSEPRCTTYAPIQNRAPRRNPYCVRLRQRLWSLVRLAIAGLGLGTRIMHLTRFPLTTPMHTPLPPSMMSPAVNKKAASFLRGLQRHVQIRGDCCGSRRAASIQGLKAPGPEIRVGVPLVWRTGPNTVRQKPYQRQGEALR